MAGWNDDNFFDSEQAEDLKSAFVQAWAKHGDRFDLLSLVNSVFVKAGIENDSILAHQATARWKTCPDIRDRMLELQLQLAPKPLVDHDDDLLRRLLMIADDPNTEPKDRISAIALVAKMKGLLKKDTEASGREGDKTSSEDLLTRLAKCLPN